jgi:Flp pilus assembly protein TadD
MLNCWNSIAPASPIVNNKEKLRPLLVCLALAAGTALLYAPVLGFDFVFYDDPLYVTHNLHIRIFNRQFLVWCFQAGYAFMWHPLTWVSHLLDFQMYGLHPGGHHATSVLLHIFNSTLLFVILNRMTKALWPSAMVAALFAWHPLHVESVAWVSERKDVLSAFLWMLTIWAYVRYVEKWKAESRKQKFFYALALVFFALGLMAKPMLVTLPFVLLLLDWWPLRRMQPSPPNPNLNLNRSPKNIHGSTESRPTAPRPTVLRLLLEKIPFVVLSILACVFTLKAAGRLVEPLAQFAVLPRILNAMLACCRYVEKIVWPKDMVVVYPEEIHRSHTEVMMAGLFLMIVSITAVRLWRTRPFWLAGWLLYLGMLVPVLGLVHVEGARPMADRYTYLPAIGIFMIICWEACDISRGWRQGRAILWTMAALVLGAFLVLSRQQLEYWRNSTTLYTHNLEVTPDNYVAHADYAAYLLSASQLEPARAECAKAIRLSANYAWAHHVLGGVLFQEGKLEEADSELRTELRLDPSRVDVHVALGQVAAARNLPAEAAAQFRAMLDHDNSDPRALVGLGVALAMQGRLNEARAQFEETVRRAPQDSEAHHQLAVVLAAQHNNAAAVSQYRMALELQPDRPDTLNNLAWILATDPHAEVRNGAEAVKFASAACRLTQGQNPFMLGTLAAAYAEDGNFDQAVATAQQAHDLAAAQGKTEIAARNLQLLEIYRSRHPYHEK